MDVVNDRYCINQPVILCIVGPHPGIDVNERDDKREKRIADEVKPVPSIKSQWPQHKLVKNKHQAETKGKFQKELYEVRHEANVECNVICLLPGFFKIQIISFFQSYQ